MDKNIHYLLVIAFKLFTCKQFDNNSRYFNVLLLSIMLGAGPRTDSVIKSLPRQFTSYNLKYVIAVRYKKSFFPFRVWRLQMIRSILWKVIIKQNQKWKFLPIYNSLMCLLNDYSNLIRCGVFGSLYYFLESKSVSAVLGHCDGVACACPIACNSFVFFDCILP